MSQRMFFCYMLQERDNHFSPLLHSGRLTHQFIVDAFACIESSRLSFISNNQKDLRAELYSGLVDALNIPGELQASQVGRQVILPGSYIGSPRWMTNLYQDAMAISRTFGRPDLFVTFTCNPHWH